MNNKGQKQTIARFAEEWKGRGYEKGDAQTFWGDLLREVVGMQGVRNKCKFEYHTSSGGFIDCYIPDSGVLIEQKGFGISLDKPEPRQGRDVTPFEQALAYAESFRGADQPRFIITCNFETFRVYDRDAHSRSDLATHFIEFTLEELGEKPSLLSFITDPSNSRAEKEKQISMQAGELIGRLHEALRNQYHNPDLPENQHALNVLCVRLVFCLFCEDAEGLFPKDALLNYLRNVDPTDMRDALKKLFKALNTPVDQRDPYDEKIKVFPYVNGGLFSEEAEIPNFTPDLKHQLLFDVSQMVDWSKISPTIFGGIFESTLNPEMRRSGGMHYTSPENIHKVIDPLFLDDLWAEYDCIRGEEGVTVKKRKAQLRAFRNKIGSLRFFDPACGSGNFLTETFLCLRRLEDDVLNDMNDGQVEISFDTTDNDKRVSLDQFHGIEINDFAVRVAKTALWIAQLQANNSSEMLLDLSIEDFPLRDSANITEGNALCIDWDEVLPASTCDYIMGNPPFLGARNQSKEQKAEIASVFNNAKNCGNIDYVAGWYMKAAEYVATHHIRCAFVSTNSICQGEQVANIWQPLYKLGIRIDFAHNTFRWGNEANSQAHVFCAIVGFSKLGGTKALFYHAGPDEEAVKMHPANINAYLVDAPDVFVWNRSTPLCVVPKIGIGNKPIDGGNYLFKEDEKNAFLKEEPGAAPLFHPWIGSEEFINKKQRWVLWLGDATAAELKALPKCRERILAVRDFRLASKSAPTQKLAEKPTRFHVENMPEGDSIIVPRVSSERRNYIPLGFVGAEVFCSDSALLIPAANIYHYGILQSRFHNAWMRTVCGRLKSDYRYSGGVVYNNYPWPQPVEAKRSEIECCAQAVLDARECYPESTLADMYDPDNDFLFPKLTAAHKALDAAVEQAYGVSFNGDEEKIVAHLFNLYAKLAGK